MARYTVGVVRNARDIACAWDDYRRLDALADERGLRRGCESVDAPLFVLLRAMARCRAAYLEACAFGDDTLAFRMLESMRLIADVLPSELVPENVNRLSDCA